jgi:hypothetical protein
LSVLEHVSGLVPLPLLLDDVPPALVLVEVPLEEVPPTLLLPPLFVDELVLLVELPPLLEDELLEEVPPLEVFELLEEVPPLEVFELLDELPPTLFDELEEVPPLSLELALLEVLPPLAELLLWLLDELPPLEELLLCEPPCPPRLVVDPDEQAIDQSILAATARLTLLIVNPPRMHSSVPGDSSMWLSAGCNPRSSGPVQSRWIDEERQEFTDAIPARTHHFRKMTRD